MKYIIILIIGLISCNTKSISPSEEIVGEWHYVGTFNDLSYNKCVVCDNYEFQPSIFYLNFNSDNTYSGRINLLVVEGKYELNKISKKENELNGEFINLKFNILNKPYETEQDSNFKNLFESANKFQLIQKNKDQRFDILNMRNSNDSYFLQFVKKE